MVGVADNGGLGLDESGRPAVNERRGGGLGAKSDGQGGGLWYVTVWLPRRQSKVAKISPT
jgi:hypothetical protein